MIACGMIQEAGYKEHVWHETIWKDHVEYRLLRHKWQRRPCTPDAANRSTRASPSPSGTPETSPQ